MTFLEGSKTDVITKSQGYETKKTVVVGFSVEMLAKNSFQV